MSRTGRMSDDERVTQIVDLFDPAIHLTVTQDHFVRQILIPSNERLNGISYLIFNEYGYLLKLSSNFIEIGLHSLFILSFHAEMCLSLWQKERASRAVH